MSPSATLQSMDPRPMSEQPAPGQLPYRPASAGPDLKLRSEAALHAFGITPTQISDHPGSVHDRPPATNGQGRSKTYGPDHTYRQTDYYPQDQSYAATVTTQNLPPRDVELLKTTCEHGLHEYQSLCRLTHKDATMMALDRTKYQRGVVLNDLRSLHFEIRNMMKEAENSRWRTWLIGGALATFIPLVRKIFRRGKDRESRVSSNNTEYAFRRAKSFLTMIKNNTLGKGSLASIGMFVFAVLYVFSSEVTIRVAKTVQRRLKKLILRIESGDTDIDDEDFKVLDGWRWRVLLW